MDIQELNNSIISFAKDRVKYIHNCLVNGKYLDDYFFSNMFIFYGKDYIEGSGFRDVWGKKGIYFFYINENIELSKDKVFKFNENAIGGKFKKYELQDLKDGDCLYIGSSSWNSLYTRINQHFKEGSFGSLHLSQKDRMILKDKVKIIAFPVKYKKLEYNAILLKIIERELHEIYIPKAGSKRI